MGLPIHDLRLRFYDMHLLWDELPEINPGDMFELQRAFYPPGFVFPMHDHDYHEIALVTDGAGWHDTEDRQERLAVGDCIRIGCNQRHRLRAASDQSLVFVNLAVRADLVERFAQAGLWSRQGPCCDRLGNGDCFAMLERIQDLERPGGCTDGLAADALLADLAWRLDRGRRRSGQMPPPLARALSALERADGLHLGAADLAREAGCSREHLNRLVRRHVGTTLVQMIQHRRLDRAAWMLRNGNDPIAEVAADCGYTSQAHFYERFRHRYGVTPAVWRQRRRLGPI